MPTLGYEGPYQIPGVGPDAPTTTNENGASQSATLYRLDLVPPLALLDVAKVLSYGAVKYGVDNWRGIPVEDHLNHALVHIYAYLSGDTQDNHLGHATCRMMMAHEQSIKETPISKESLPFIDCICGVRYWGTPPDKCDNCKAIFLK